MNRRAKLSSSPCQAGSTEVSVMTLGPFFLDATKGCHMVFDEQIRAAPEGGLPKKVSVSSELGFCLHGHQQLSSRISYSFQTQTLNSPPSHLCHS